jgi:hypothetical protein
MALLGVTATTTASRATTTAARAITTVVLINTTMMVLLFYATVETDLPMPVF